MAVAYQNRSSQIQQRFYQGTALSTLLNGDVVITAVHGVSKHQPLAQLSSDGERGEKTLLATNLSGSPMIAQKGEKLDGMCYSAYGVRPAMDNLDELPGFNSEYLDTFLQGYALGNGYRFYSPVLMRFASADATSPFQQGGLNAYCYCLSDPVNNVDPTGLSGFSFLQALFAKGSNGASVPGRRASLTSSRRSSSSSFQSTEISMSRSSSSASVFEPGAAMRDARAATASPQRPWPAVSPEPVGYHGSDASNAASLLSGINRRHLGTSGGVRGVGGFFVAPRRGLAQDFAEVSAENYAEGRPQVFSVHIQNFSAMQPGRHYTLRPMGGGGINRVRAMGEMELVFEPVAFSRIRIREGGLDGRQVRPRSRSF